MADYQKVVALLGENLAAFLELSKKFLLDWAIDPKKLFHFLHNVCKEEFLGLLAGTHEIKPKQGDKSIVVSNRDSRYGTPTVVQMTVPLDYHHDRFIDEFITRKKRLGSTKYTNPDLTSEHFPKATHQLVPGKTYEVMFFPILRPVTSQDNLAQTKRQSGAMLVGGYGIFLAQELIPSSFPNGKYAISMDESENLWKDAGGNHGLPSVCYRPGDGWRFFLLSPDTSTLDYYNYCLVCFCDESRVSQEPV